MSKFFIRRPIVAMVIAILTVILGVVSMTTLPTSQYPNIVPPEIMVQATYPGADAKTLVRVESAGVRTPRQLHCDRLCYSASINNLTASICLSKKHMGSVGRDT